MFCGYQVFWATYSFSAYLHEQEIGLSVVAAGFITTLKLWMRPIGGIGGGSRRPLLEDLGARVRAVRGAPRCSC